MRIPPLHRIAQLLTRLANGPLRRTRVKLGLAINYGNNLKAGSYYDINDIKIYAEVYGDGEPLLMLHGNGGNIGAFAHNIPYFANKYKVIAVDSRAQGRSVDNGESISFEMMADDFATLLDAMNIGYCNILGWSDGGITALLMAMRHPQKVKKLAAVGANLTPGPDVFAPGAWQHWERMYHQRKNKPYKTAKEKNDWKLFRLDFEQPQLAFNELKAIKCPSLIICGDNELITIEHTRQIAGHIPNGRLWVVPNSGHAPLTDHRDLFNETVDQFFSA